jgi:proline iminopeptidase
MMKTTVSSAILLLATVFAHGQSIYTRAFGNAKDKPVIFLHGGPGYNSAVFEATTAQPLADKGFYVIVFDRRGEGRSKDPNAQFTFQETFDDLKAVYQKYGLTKCTLIGHSFGGVVATLFAEKNPENVQSIVLVGAPVSLQETFKTIIAASKTIYQAKHDSVNLNYISMLENMDKRSIEYSSYCFMHAMANGFYSPKNPTEEAKAIYSRFKTDTLLTKYAFQMSYQAPQGFWKNEKYTTIELTSDLKSLIDKHVNVFGLYGKDDGLYSADQVKSLQNLLGENNVKYFDRCSHSVFVDQQSQFIASVERWAK